MSNDKQQRRLHDHLNLVAKEILRERRVEIDFSEIRNNFQIAVDLGYLSAQRINRELRSPTLPNMVKLPCGRLAVRTAWEEGRTFIPPLPSVSVQI